MSKSWPKVRLGDVLRPVTRFEAVDASKEYRLLGVRLEGRGPFLRETVSGSVTAATRLNRVEAGDFIYFRLFAGRGAFGVIPKELHGCYVSGEFPTYLPNKERLDFHFLRYWFHLPATICAVEEDCSGSTPLTRNRFKEEFFLALEIPLPPLAEQRRIVARIDELAAHIHEARTLRQQVIEDLEILCRVILSADDRAVKTPMKDLVRLRKPDVRVLPEGTYKFAGVYSFGRGLFSSQERAGMEFSYPLLTRLRTGDFTYPKLMAWEGAFGVVPDDCDGHVVSTEFPVFEIDQEVVLPEVVDVYFRSPKVWPEIAGASTGTNVRRRRLNPKDFLNYHIPLPSRETQLKLRSVKQQVEIVKHCQSASAAEVDALLPSILDRAFAGCL